MYPQQSVNRRDRVDPWAGLDVSEKIKSYCPWRDPNTGQSSSQSSRPTDYATWTRLYWFWTRQWRWLDPNTTGYTPGYVLYRTKTQNEQNTSLTTCTRRHILDAILRFLYKNFALRIAVLHAAHRLATGAMQANALLRYSQDPKTHSSPAKWRPPDAIPRSWIFAKNLGICNPA